MSYDMVLDYIRSCKDYYEVNGVRIYPSERIILVEVNDFYIVIQAQTTDAWNKLLEIVDSNPSHIYKIIDYLETSKEALLTGTISIMRLKKEDIDSLLP